MIIKKIISLLDMVKVVIKIKYKKLGFDKINL